MDELSNEELAVRSGVTAEQLRRLVELGILTPTLADTFRPSDIQRIRVVDTLAEAGFAPEQLSELIATGAYDLDWANVVFPEPTAQLTTTLEETAAAIGLPEDLAARLFDAWELPRPQPGQALRAHDDEPHRSRRMTSGSQSVWGSAPMRTNRAVAGTVSVPPEVRSLRVRPVRRPSPWPSTVSVW
jgi:DNA-binding transcriptional MerR regulator